MTEFPLDEVLDMQKQFAILYRTTGMIGISDNYVQVTTATLAGLADPTTWDIYTHIWKQEAASLHASVEIRGIPFTAVLHEGEMTEYGLEEPEWTHSDE